MRDRRVVVATHGHCFDGMASAVLFEKLFRGLKTEALDQSKYAFEYISCGYGPQMKFPPKEWFSGDHNAILDFRFSPAPSVDWYFDHHMTGFSSSEEEKAAGKVPGRSVHFDPSYSSCTKLIRDVASATYGIDLGLADLIGWADKIDAAAFSSAEEAVQRTDPAMQLASVVEHHSDGPFLRHMVPLLLERSLMEVCASEYVQERWKPLATLHNEMVERVRESSVMKGDVVVVDLSSAPLETAAKFAAYALHPECVYSVALSRSKHHLKLSVGYNPWAPRPRTIDIAPICKRYGGGGHPAVGGASFGLKELDRARSVVAEITEELSEG